MTPYSWYKECYLQTLQLSSQRMTKKLKIYDINYCVQFSIILKLFYGLSKYIDTKTEIIIVDCPCDCCLVQNNNIIFLIFHLQDLNVYGSTYTNQHLLGDWSYYSSVWLDTSTWRVSLPYYPFVIFYVFKT